MITINTLLASKNDAKRIKILSIYLKAIANLHYAGKKASIVVSNHYSNLDTFDIEPSDGASESNQSNLENCLSLLNPCYDRYLPDAINNSNFKIHWPKLNKAIYTNRKKYEKNINQCFKSNDNEIQKNWYSFKVIKKKYDSQPLQKILNKPDQAISEGVLLKDCAATTVCLYTMEDGKRAIIKRYNNSKGTLYSLTRSLIDSRARVCWKSALLLKNAGINTPDNIAMIEYRKGPWISTSYLITEFIEGEVLADFFSEKNQHKWKHIVNQVSDILYSFISIRVAHGDFKSTNFMISNNKVIMIDLDSVSSYRVKMLFNRTYYRDINRFDRNWIDLPVAAQLFSPIIQSIKKLL